MKELLIKLGYNKWLSDYSEKYHHLKGWKESDSYLDESELPIELEYCLIQKWLREGHNIYIVITPDEILGFDLKLKSWKFSPKYIDVYKTYEEAFKAGIEESLKLINIK